MTLDAEDKAFIRQVIREEVLRYKHEMSNTDDLTMDDVKKLQREKFRKVQQERKKP